MAQRLLCGLRGAVKNVAGRRVTQFYRLSTTNYVSEMRNSAFEGNILRLIRNEIQYEHDHFPSFQPPPEFSSFKIDERPGEQWIRLSRKFGENEDIKVEVTMFDGSAPTKKTDDSLDVKLHITLIVDVFKGDGSEVLEFVCSAWPDSIDIRRVYTREHRKINDQPYTGPAFKELDDELQDSLYDFLEARGIDDSLTEFLHQYMRYKDKSEYLGWLENIKSFIQERQRNGIH